MKGVNIFLANGFEDIEALATHDVLRRGGVKCNLIGISDEPFVESSHGITVGVSDFLPEMEISHEGTDRKDVMIFPGGMPGTKNLAACKPLIRAMKDHYAAGGSLAAICAAPGYVLGQLDSLEGIEFTCFDGCEGDAVAKGGTFLPEPAVRCGRIITGRSAGHSIAFAKLILELLKGEETVKEVNHSMFLSNE